MSAHPYSSLPPYAFWRRSVAEPEISAVDPVVVGKFKIQPTDKVATGGSCFAQHIARHLAASGFHYLVTETAHPRVAALAQAFNYGTYSARYGNLYTARQLLQLFHRAYGLFTPKEDSWISDKGEVKDAFRPEIQPGGFASLRELHLDRAQHFTAVRTMVESLDVFVFTLGLTEAWVSKEDGAVFPICPGVAGGKFDPDRHEFVNFGVDEVVADLNAAIKFIKDRNPKARFVITVSPVPLKATAAGQSVLVSTALSKAILRVAAEQVSSGQEDIAYFPSYEIITGAHSRGQYFESDLRSVRDVGVSHVMRLFLKHYTDAETAPAIAVSKPKTDESANHLSLMKKGAALICEEELLDQEDE